MACHVVLPGSRPSTNDDPPLCATSGSYEVQRLSYSEPLHGHASRSCALALHKVLPPMHRRCDMDLTSRWKASHSTHGRSMVWNVDHGSSSATIYRTFVGIIASHLGPAFFTMEPSLHRRLESSLPSPSVVTHNGRTLLPRSTASLPVVPTVQVRPPTPSFTRRPTADQPVGPSSASRFRRLEDVSQLCSVFSVKTDCPAARFQLSTPLSCFASTAEVSRDVL